MSLVLFANQHNYLTPQRPQTSESRCLSLACYFDYCLILSDCEGSTYLVAYGQTRHSKKVTAKICSYQCSQINLTSKYSSPSLPRGIFDHLDVRTRVQVHS